MKCQSNFYAHYFLTYHLIKQYQPISEGVGREAVERVFISSYQLIIAGPLTNTGGRIKGSSV